MVSLRCTAQTDFLNDNVLYRTLYPKDLQSFLASNPGTTIIDVRSPGEFSDTSRFGSLNIGRIKDAINIPVDSFSSSLEKLSNLKDKPVILYCSHSQRSRRAGKKLNENGFKMIYNLNGGMSWLNQANEIEFPGKKQLLENSLPYRSIPASEIREFMKQDEKLLIIDVRSEAEFLGKDSLDANNLGRIKGALNLPAKEKTIDLVKMPARTSRILVYDLNGAYSDHICRFLVKNGYTNVYNLLGGLHAVIGKDKFSADTRAQILEGTPAYRIINVKESIALMEKEPGLTIIDVRSAEDFANNSKNQWQRLGHIKGAVNFPPDELEGRRKALQDKNAMILVYGNSQASKLSRILTENGFTNVQLLYGGIWDMVSLYANVYGFSEMKKYLEGYEGLY